MLINTSCLQPHDCRYGCCTGLSETVFSIKLTLHGGQGLPGALSRIRLAFRCKLVSTSCEENNPVGRKQPMKQRYAGLTNILPCAARNPVNRKQPIRCSVTQDHPRTLRSHWLFPAHRFFRHAGQDVTESTLSLAVSSLPSFLLRRDVGQEVD
jgi:hypothetical protein